MTQPLIVRVARQADIKPMHGIRLAVSENRLSDPNRIGEQSYAPYLAAESAWVAEMNGAVLGFAILDVIECSVWALFVDPDHEGKGLGLALHARILASSRERGLERLSLATGPDTRAARFYRELGWFEVGRASGGDLLFERLL
jgi:GNAT superfamily N-acetyltransferase